MALAQILALVAAIGSGLIGGIFLIFSTTIVASLEQLPIEQTVAGMQAINRVIQRPIFLLVFVGTALVSVAVVVTTPAAPLAWIGAVLYVLATFGLTMVVNVPLNNALDRARGGGAEAWRAFRPRWMVANHVRTVASIGAAVAFTLLG
ncbi:DUF1772 domain-containing protein [Pseudonocardia sp. CA-107938]|uniref:anthrone oxygenase family protein n=1 Tax=Pseudonocardia sp. CA-107938 TaxID=3240021 RepID=UPI003D8BF0BE